MRSPWLLPLITLVVYLMADGLARAEAAIPSGEEMGAAGARIGFIQIRRLNIFDPSDPAEDYLPYRIANKLHIVTREEVIRRELLFREGDAYRQDLIDESERNLRAVDTLTHIRIRPVAYHDGVVDLEVSCQDTWTLRPSLRFSRAGGDNTSSFSFSEKNLLGRMKNLSLSRRKDVDRTSTGILYWDPRLFGTRFNLNALLADSSDGESRGIGVARPFFSLDSRWAVSASGQHFDQTSRLFRNGDTLAEFRQASESLSLSYAFSGGLRDSRVHRYGFGYGYVRNRFTQDAEDEGFGIEGLGPPDWQKFSGPFLTLQRTRSRYIKVTNYNKFDRQEDFNLGNDLNLMGQFSLRAFGATLSEFIFSANDTFGIPLSDSLNLFLSFSLSGRTGSGEVSNLTFSEVGESYWRITSHQTFYTRLAFDAGIHLDGQNQLLLGGDTGLRGYPTRQFAGDRRLLLSLEHRYFGDWEILRLVRIGFATFADTGNAWYGDTGQKVSELHPDFGFGLRFAVTRSSVASVSRLDLAYSVDAEQTDSPRFQILFGTAVRF